MNIDDIDQTPINDGLKWSVVDKDYNRERFANKREAMKALKEHGHEISDYEWFWTACGGHSSPEWRAVAFAQK